MDTTLHDDVLSPDWITGFDLDLPAARQGDAAPSTHGMGGLVNSPRPALAGISRRSVAILAADIVGYSRLIEQDDLATVIRLRTLMRQLVRPAIATHGGELVRQAGDGLLIAFDHPPDAVACARALRDGMELAERARPRDRRIVLRIGISFERALTVDGDLHGHGVNVAARLEQMAEPGEIYMCGLVAATYAAGRPGLLEPLGLKWLKNMSAPVDVFRLAT